jgi:hypothetical protein
MVRFPAGFSPPGGFAATLPSRGGMAPPMRELLQLNNTAPDT